MLTKAVTSKIKKTVSEKFLLTGTSCLRYFQSNFKQEKGHRAFKIFSLIYDFVMYNLSLATFSGFQLIASYNLN